VPLEPVGQLMPPSHMPPVLLHCWLCLQAITAAGVRLVSWQELLDVGERQPQAPIPPKPDDLCTIMYTSGTTGGCVRGVGP
jgi:acyl-coenzyme A synthetase/AMP-(fatty) acid ligase